MTEFLEAADRLCAAIRAHAEALTSTPRLSTAVVPAGVEVAGQTGWSRPAGQDSLVS
ncbi:hypothetical protein [Herbidospora sp. NBRC 101105]|uniref:hypothetical protein n=1 Tax=Herbidospora sp. NBRC 101105 TaxID=3032195 RepID=UPI002554D13D|nr:hypothetical protein [Herbidospora sp. NBRC 101105]